MLEMLEEIGKKAKLASYRLSALSCAEKNRALHVIADMLEQHAQEIITANSEDMEQARAAEISEAILDRLYLSPSRLAAIANDVREICSLDDPVGKVIDGGILDSGLKLERRRVPLGVIGAIYEARPNVTIDVATLCLKTGNAVILRGGKETINTNRIMVDIIQRALEKCNLPIEAVQSINDPDRTLVTEMLKMDRYIDMLIPRGGPALHQLCRENSTIPVITGGIGVCHIFVDESVDAEKALAVIENAKTQRPSTCNTLETLLVHRAIANDFLPLLSSKMEACNVTLHASQEALVLLENQPASVMLVSEEQYQKEWLSLDLNVTIVDDLEQAVQHIRTYGSGHSDAILTRCISNAEQFVRSVDSAAVYVNASTRFTDGGQFGLGAEVAVSTQKLHARGPMGLEALTTYKWIGYGDDLVRR